MSKNLEKLMKFGLLMYAICAPWSISGAQIGLGLALIGHHSAHRADTWRSSGLENPLFLMACAGAFSLVNAVDLFRGVIEMKKFLILIPFWLPFWIPMGKQFQRKVLGAVIGMSSLTAVYGCVSFLWFWSDKVRADGPFSLPLTFGECQSLALTASILWLQAGEENDFTRKGLYISVMLQTLAIIASMSRGAWIGLFLGLLYIFWKNVRVFLTIFLMIGMTLFILTASNEFYRSRFFLGYKDDWVRFRIWQMGATLFSEKPVFGVGMNNIKPLYKARVTDEEREKKWVFGHQHNNFMHMLVMTGLLGFMAFCWWLVEMGYFCISVSNGIEDPWQKRMAGNLFALFLCFWGSGLTEYSFGDEEVAMLFFFLMGLLANPLSRTIPDAKANAL